MMKIQSARFLSFIFFASLLLGSKSYGGTIDTTYPTSKWGANQVVLRITGVPPGVSVVACVFEGDSCDIKSSARSAKAPISGVVDMIIPISGDVYVVDDTIRISDPDCAVLSTGGQIGDKNCGEVCEECQAPIPTLTEWGMIILVLLIMAAGTVVIIRKRRVMAR